MVRLRVLLKKIEARDSLGICLVALCTDDDDRYSLGDVSLGVESGSEDNVCELSGQLVYPRAGSGSECSVSGLSGQLGGTHSDSGLHSESVSDEGFQNALPGERIRSELGGGGVANPARGHNY